MTALPSYEISKITDHIYGVHIENKYDRAMTFCRAQEFYESPNDKFRGNAFSIWEYIKWYSHENKQGFSYAFDWSGFNLPIKEVIRCYQTLEDTYGNEDHTIYDKALLEIIERIKKESNLSKKDLNKSYIIGVGKAINDTFKHEICHGLFSTHRSYKLKAIKLLNNLEKQYPKEFKILENNILKMGYCQAIVKDEIQAYLQFGHTESEFGEGVDMEKRNLLNQKYKKELYDTFAKI